MKNRIFLFLFVLPLFLNAQSFRNYSNEFLNIGVDAAGLGKSKAVVATTNNVNAIYWNPAGLVGIEDYQGSLMHASYFAGIANYNHAAFAMPIDSKSAIGISIIRFGVDDILNTTELIDSQGNIDFNRISLFSTADYAFNFAYARNLLFKDVNFGVNILACSLPFSTILIIGIFSFSEFFVNPVALIGIGLSALAVSYAPDIFKSRSFMMDREKRTLDAPLRKKSALKIKRKSTLEEVANESKAS